MDSIVEGWDLEEEEEGGGGGIGWSDSDDELLCLLFL